MNVGNSIRKAIDDWQQSEFESSMLHACNAVEGTASKLYPKKGSNARFTQFLRENYAIFGPMAVPGIDLVKTRWPVKVTHPKAPGGKPDLADIIYGIHRCTHGHGAELPNGFALLLNASGPHRVTHLIVEKGKVRLSDRVIFGLIGVAVFSPVNLDQCVPPDYHLTFAGETLLINDWWGRASDFTKRAALEPVPSIHLNFTDWMDE